MINKIRIVDNKIVGCPIGMMDPQECLKCEYCNSAVTLVSLVQRSQVQISPGALPIWQLLVDFGSWGYSDNGNTMDSKPKVLGSIPSNPINGYQAKGVVRWEFCKLQIWDATSQVPFI